MIWPIGKHSSLTTIKNKKAVAKTMFFTVKQKDAYCHVKGILLLLNTRLFARPNTTYGKKKRRIFNVTMSQYSLYYWLTGCYTVTLA